MQSKSVRIKVWKEGRNIIVRNDEFHINTYGKNLDQALENFHEAYLLTLEDKDLFKGKIPEVLTLLIDYPFSKKSKQQATLKMV